MDAEKTGQQAAPYTLRREADGLVLWYGERSVLGPLRLQFDVSDAAGRRCELSDVLLVAEPGERVGQGERLRFRTAALPGASFAVTVTLSPAGLLLVPAVRAGAAALRLHAFRVLAQPPAESLLAGVGMEPGWRILGAGYSSFSPVASRDSRHVLVPPRLATAGTFNQHTQSEYWGRADVLSSPWMLTATRRAGAAPGGTRAETLTLLMGFLAAERGLGEVALLRDGAPRPRLEARLDWGGRPLPAGSELVGEPLLISAGSDGEELIRSWTEQTAQRMQARRPAAPIPSGWCSWYYYYTRVSEAAVAANLSCLQQQRAALPVQYVQLDDGYQKKVGDWLHLNPKFPGGLPALAQRIRAAGAVPGIWTAPFLCQRGSQVWKQHRDWLLRDPDGRLRRLGYHPFWGILDGYVYSLDPTHPGVQDYLRTVFRSLCADGFEYFKIDFLFAGLRAGRHYDEGQSPVEAYRTGLRCIREAIGDRFLLGCGAPLLPSIGVVDAMRISPDVKEVWRDPTIGLLAGETGHPAAELAILNCLTRAHLHGVFWINDPDCLLVRREHTKLTLAEVRTLVSVLSLTGGMLFVSDDLQSLAAPRRALLELALPPAGEAARVLGAFFESKPERFVRTRALAAGGGVEALAAVINFSDHPLARTILPEDLGLAPGAYHAFELWTRSYQRLGRGQAVVTTQPPHGVALLLLRPQRPWPQVLTVTHHLGQTTVLLAHETWDAETATLVVGLHALAERSGEVLLALPAPWQLGAVSGSAGLAVGAWGRAPAGAYVTVSFTAPGGIEVLTLRFTGSQPAAAPQL
jgi:alpha-galactosidase